MKETNIKIHDVSHGVIVQLPLPLPNPISWFNPILFHGSMTFSQNRNVK